MISGSDALPYNYRELVSRIEKVPGVTATAPYLWLDAFIEDSSVLTLKGVLPEKETVATGIGHYVQSGDFATRLATLDQDIAPLVIGKPLATWLGSGVGDTVALSKASVSTKAIPAKITGTFQGTIHDTGMVYTSLSWAQRMRDGGSDCVNMIGVNTHDAMKSDQIARSIRAVLGANYAVTDWSDIYSTFKAPITLFKRWVLILNVLFALFSGMFTAGAVLLIMSQKRRELAILLTLGMQARSLRLIMALVGTIIGFTGSFCALLSAPILFHFLNHYQVMRLPQPAVNIGYIPFLLAPLDLTWVVMAAIGIPALFGWLVAGYLNRLKPADMLRDE